jgi:CheY-like chemotaxis protein
MEAAQLLNILVVDDDPGHAELVRRNLQRAGVANPIHPIASGREALDYVFRRGQHTHRDGRELIMLLDINMPGGIDGVDVLRQIQSHETTRQLPVIMLTTTDDPREINRCYALGCNVYVTKPVDSSAFIEAIARLGLFISIVKPPSMAEVRL